MSSIVPVALPPNAPQDLGIHHVLETQAKRNPDAIAIAAPGRCPLAYSRLRLLVDDVVQTLNAMGVGRNDRVAMVLSNGPEMAAAFIGVAAGATAAPLNPAFRSNEFDFYLLDLNAKVLMIQSGMASPARAIAQARGIPIIELSPVVEAEAGIFMLTGAEHLRPAHGGFAQPNDMALVLHTSGTTSRPKLVPLTQANLCTSAQNIRVALELVEGDRCLNVMPLFHIHGLIGAMLSSLMAGASMVCTPGFYAPQFFEWMEEFRPTWYTAVPTMHQAILARAAANREIIACCPLRFIRSSSSALPPQVLAELERVFSVPVIESYGMTEASHQMTTNPLPPRQRKAGSVGVAAGPEVAIMDQGGNVLPAGETGEIVIRGANVTQGYENNPPANQSAFTHGWFRTGDEGYVARDGYLFITGRLKEIINRGGEKIAPREVEEVLMDHPAVAQVVSFAVPHATLGEEVAAAIVLREKVWVTEREIREFAAGRLADFKVPQQVVIVDEIPKGPTGKLQRIGLAETLGLTASDQAAPGVEAAYTAPNTLAEEELAAIWSQVLGVEAVGIHDDFFRLGGDSILAAQIVARVRDAMQEELSILNFFETPTVEGLAQALREEEPSREWTSVIPLQPHGSKPPFFFLAGRSHFGARLGPDQPVYRVVYQDLEREQPLVRVEAMAAHSIQSMRRVQPDGPYYLGGHGFGGLVAFEIAHQLQRQGEKVALLTLCESWAPGSRRSTPGPSSAYRLWQRARYYCERARHTGARQELAALLRGLKNKTQRAAGRRQGGPRTRSRQGYRAAIDDSCSHYVPQAYPGRITVVRCTERAPWRDDDPLNGWGRLATDGVEAYAVPGSHTSIYREPNVEVLARTLNDVLRKAQTRAESEQT